MIFLIEESQFNKGKYIIRYKVNLSHFPNGINSSFSVLEARVMNLSFPDYLRFCRDKFNAEIIGKNNFYPIIYFKTKEDGLKLVTLLNKRMKEVENV